MLAGNDDPRRTYPLRVPAWHDVPKLVHGFLGREQGLAPGPFSIADLRARLAAVGEAPARVLAVRQVHGARVLACETAARAAPDDVELARDLPEADALISTEDVILTVRTADCVPILLVAPAPRAVAAIHAGWRGMLAGVIESTIAALAERHSAPAGGLLAAVGPAIGGCCYEFGAEHLAGFVARLGPPALGAWRPPALDRAAPPTGETPARGHLDLRALARIALERAGLRPEAISTIGPCTVEHPAELHSYRRDGGNAGRQLSYVGWRA